MTDSSSGPAVAQHEAEADRSRAEAEALEKKQQIHQD